MTRLNAMPAMQHAACNDEALLGQLHWIWSISTIQDAGLILLYAY